MTHSDAVNAVLLHLSSLGCMVARREVGLFTDPRGYKRHIGVEGEADVQGTTPAGRSVAVEVKTGKGLLRTEQERWRDAFLARNGLYAVSRPDTDPDWKAGLSQLVAQS